MTPPLNRDQQDAFAAALVSEIKAEMGRRDLSSRGLGELIGHSSQYMSMRLDGGSAKTGKRTPLNVGDIAAIASAFGMEPYELLALAQRAMTPQDAEIVRPKFGAGRKRDDWQKIDDDAAWDE